MKLTVFQKIGHLRGAITVEEHWETAKGTIVPIAAHSVKSEGSKRVAVICRSRAALRLMSVGGPSLPPYLEMYGVHVLNVIGNMRSPFEGGALGSEIIGAGGGLMMLIVERTRRQHVENALQGPKLAQNMTPMLTEIHDRVGRSRPAAVH